VTDFLDEKHRQITARLEELKPLVDEYSRLEAAAAALAGVGATLSAGAAGASAPRRGPGRPRGATGGPAAPKRAVRPAPKPARPAKRRAGRGKGSGKRAAEALSFVQGQPGITIPELAAKIGMKQNYLYRVLPALEQERKLKRLGRGWAAWDGWDLGP
jgi:hypothetical protein